MSIYSNTFRSVRPPWPLFRSQALTDATQPRTSSVGVKRVLDPSILVSNGTVDEYQERELMMGE